MYKLVKKQSTCNNVQSACKDFMSDVVTCKTAPSPIKVLVSGKSCNWLLSVTVVTICCLFSVMYTILTAFFNGPFAGSMARRTISEMHYSWWTLASRCGWYSSMALLLWVKHNKQLYYIYTFNQGNGKYKRALTIEPSEYPEHQQTQPFNSWNHICLS